MSLRPNDLPPEASEAINLVAALNQYADWELRFSYPWTRKVARADGRFHYFQSPNNEKGYILLAFMGPEDKCRDPRRKLTRKVESGFIHALSRGVLKAWGRKSSPLEPLEEIPASVWPYLQLDRFYERIVTDPSSTRYFDVWVAPRISTPLIPARGKPGRPSPFKDLIMKEFERRYRHCLNEPSKAGEARALAAGFLRKYPHAKDPPEENTVRNWLTKAKVTLCVRTHNKKK
jgi:hypothetical protein